MQIITSPDNGRIKSVCRLYDKKYRRAERRYVTEGYRNVKDSLPQLVNAEVYLSESAFAKYRDEFPSAFVCSDAVFAKMSDTENSQGVLCVSDIPAAAIDFTKNCIFLDAIADPGNAGTIMRSCLATGFANVFACRGADCYGPKTVRSAMSAVSRLNITECNDAMILGRLKDASYKIVCADMGGDNLFEKSYGDCKICLVIGSEANGISKEAAAYADEIVSLPMERIESLNAAVCASIIMYHIRYNQTKIGG